MVEGKVKRFLSEVSLLSQNFVKDSEITVQEMCKEMIKEDYKIASRAMLLKENKLNLPNSIKD